MAIPKNLDSIAQQQLALALYDPEAKKEKAALRFVWTVKKDSVLSTKSAYPGIYVFSSDSIAPKIEALNFKDQQWVSNYKFLELRIEDDFSGIKSYRASINDQWILMENEPKNKTLMYDFNDLEFDRTQLDFKLEVEDQVGNKAFFEATLFRKPQR